jgi:hypothetical protein
MNSNICQIAEDYKKSNQAAYQDNDSIAHYECMQCVQCDSKIKVFDEYSFDSKKKLLLCKACESNRIEVKKSITLKKNSQRLSTRQKELIKLNFSFVDDIDKFMDHKDDIYKYAIEISCSKKSISDFLTNQINRKTRQRMPKKNASNNKKTQIEYTTSMATNITDQLTKLDKTLPPNQSPFEKFI